MKAKLPNEATKYLKTKDFRFWNSQIKAIESRFQKLAQGLACVFSGFAGAPRNPSTVQQTMSSRTKKQSHFVEEIRELSFRSRWSSTTGGATPPALIRQSRFSHRSHCENRGWHLLPQRRAGEGMSELAAEVQEQIHFGQLTLHLRVSKVGNEKHHD